MHSVSLPTRVTIDAGISSNESGSGSDATRFGSSARE
jgi:hypothetical protein